MNEQGKVGRTPTSYQPAKWRCTLPADEVEGVMGVAFDLPDGQVLRLALPLDDARNLAESIQDYLMASQSEMSSGIPIADGSIPPGNEKT